MIFCLKLEVNQNHLKIKEENKNHLEILEEE